MTTEARKKLKLKRRLDEAVYDELLNSFFAGIYGESYEFNPATIAGEYEVSITPVTLALKRLYNERLIERTQGGKYIVPRCEAADICQLCDVRLMFEKKCFVSIMQRNDVATMDEIARLGEVCKDFTDKNDPIGFLRADTELHGIIIDSYGNSYISMLYKLVRNKMIACNSRLNNGSEMQIQANREHDALIAAMKKRDYDCAEKLLEQHVDNVRDRILNCLNKCSQA